MLPELAPPNSDDAVAAINAADLLVDVLGPMVRDVFCEAPVYSEAIVWSDPPPPADPYAAHREQNENRCGSLRIHIAALEDEERELLEDLEVLRRNLAHARQELDQR